MERRLLSDAQEIKVVLIIGLIITTLFMLFAFTADWYLWKPDPYLAASRSINLFRIVPVIIAEQVAINQNGQTDNETGRLSSLSDQLQYLDQDDYELILRQLFRQEWLETNTENLLTQIFSYLNLRTSQLSLWVSMGEIKAQLRGELGTSIVQRIIASWPACNQEQAQVFVEEGVSGDPRILPVCQPPVELQPLFTTAVETRMRIFADEIPERIDLLRFLRGIGTDEVFFRQEMRDTAPVVVGHSRVYIFMRWLLRLSPLFAIWVLVVMGLYLRYNRVSVIPWFGGGLLATGLLALIISLFFGLPIITTLVRTVISNPNMNMGFLVTQAVLTMSRFVAQRYLLWVSLQAGILVLGGSGLLGAWYYRRKSLGPWI